MTSRIFAALLAVPFALLACSSPDGGTTGDDQNVTSAGDVGSTCAGIANIQCKDGLRCNVEGTYPDAAGKCESVAPGELNGICGGIGGFVCKDGLECVSNEGNTHPDSAGVCRATTPINCQAIPACNTGEAESQTACAATESATCKKLSLCGRTIFCRKPVVQCQAIAACNAGELGSQTPCADSEADSCTDRTLCGHVLFCRSTLIAK